MFLLLILPILVSGFITLHIVPAYFYRLHRQEGQYLYIQAARYGVYNLLWILLGMFFAFSSHYFDFNLPSCIAEFLLTQNLLTRQLLAIQVGWTVTIAILLLLFPWLRWLAFWFFAVAYQCYHAKALRFSTKAVKPWLIEPLLSDSPLDQLLFKASIEKEDMPIMLSMSDRKVYVGVISSMGEPNESAGADQEIVIRPIMSGYRDKDTLAVRFTTIYEVDQNQADAQSSKDEIELVLKQDEIVSATKFSWAAHSVFSTG